MSRRVVVDQKEKFDNDEIFRKLSRESEIRYTGCREKSLEERQKIFETQCRQGHAELSNSWSDRQDERKITQEFVNFEQEPGKVHLKSQLIFNGVCVSMRGWVDLKRLDGTARLEYDDERAQVEDILLRRGGGGDGEEERQGGDYRGEMGRGEGGREVGEDREIIDASRRRARHLMTSHKAPPRTNSRAHPLACSNSCRPAAVTSAKNTVTGVQLL